MVITRRQTMLGGLGANFSATQHVNAPLAMVEAVTGQSFVDRTHGQLVTRGTEYDPPTFKFRPDLVGNVTGAMPLSRILIYGGVGVVGIYILFRIFGGKGGHSEVPIKQNPPRRRNPERVPVVTRTERLKKAVASYESFHWGDAPSKIVKRKVSKAPRAGMKLGKLVSVAYETHKNGEHAVWEHEFGEEGGKRPDLVADVDTDRLHIVGGDYKIRPEGIID